MPDWKSQATLERLVAALIAANNGKVYNDFVVAALNVSLLCLLLFTQVDNQAVARYMDETYDSVENRTRVYKREAQKLVKEAEQAGRMEMDMRKRGSTSPRKGGPHEPRATPSKKNAGGVKGRCIINYAKYDIH